MKRPPPSRRAFLSGLLATGASAACAPVGPGLRDGGTGAPTQAGGAGAFMLLPLTGEGAEIGAAMSKAAGLAAPAGPLPRILDTRDTAAGAAAAATEARAAGARLLLGPLRADQVADVVAAAGSVPVVTFSNDDAARATGAFVFGVTPAQSVATMLTYAKARGARRIAVVASDSALGRATAVAAEQLAKAAGLSLAATVLRRPQAEGTLAALRLASGGVMPDAVILPDGGATLGAFAQGLRGGGVQILGSVQWGVSDVASNPDLDGAWFAAPAPGPFQTFAAQYETAFGSTPGLIAALAHDAAALAIELNLSRSMTRRGLLRPRGFVGVLGHYRFDADGTCRRDLAVMGVEGGRLVALGEVTEA
jgi:branched-chain amino acid transport system substrate-binding protein